MIGLRNTVLKKISDAGYGLFPYPFLIIKCIFIFNEKSN